MRAQLTRTSDFHVCDVLDIPRTVTRSFDIIYMLNAFYAFARQRDALAALRKSPRLPHNSSSSITPSAPAANEESLKVDGRMLIPHAIRVSEISSMLRETGWTPGTIEDLSTDYTRWYATFVERIRRKRDEIEKIGGVEWYDFVLAMYSGLHGVIAQGTLGGVLIHARADG